ncbi:MAG TPA: DUF6098 family protein [Mycobacteriales bacterium]|jgi:hypothetical protein|nr:DUF6098 family protein [Mycobacteriales bacterium]
MAPPARADDLPVLETVHDVVELVQRHGRNLYVRWSQGPAADSGAQSRDDLTGVRLPGLSASALAVEDWWEGRSLDAWVARRLYDYRHLRDRRGARPWLMLGSEVGRGPDNEPLVRCDEPLAWIAESVVARCERLIDEQAGDWGTLDRQDEPA